MIVAESVTVELPRLSATGVDRDPDRVRAGRRVRVIPDTVKVPLPPATVPAEVVPSPQLIVAEYALAVALVFGSEIVATVVFSGVPATR